MKKDPDCPICGENPTIRELIDYEGFCGMPAREGQEIEQIRLCSAAEYATRRDGGEKIVLLDVRESDEVERAKIGGTQWIPLGELEARIGELTAARSSPIVVYCHHGGRSEKAVRLLLERGFSGVENLDGGIEAWSLTVDPSVPRY